MQINHACQLEVASLKCSLYWYKSYLQISLHQPHACIFRLAGWLVFQSVLRQKLEVLHQSHEDGKEVIECKYITRAGSGSSAEWEFVLPRWMTGTNHLASFIKIPWKRD